MDHAWLLMHSHAQTETRLHSGELGAAQVEADDDNKDARSGFSEDSKGSKAKGVGRPSKPKRPAPISPASAVPPPTQATYWL